jgi:hypothetical protein
MTDFLKEGNVVKGGVNETTSIVDRPLPPTPTKPKKVDPAAIREAALREAYGVLQNWVYCCDAEDEILALIGEKK